MSKENMPDVLVLGAGPAGMAIASALGKEKLDVEVLSPNGPDEAWPNTYGIWGEEVVVYTSGQLPLVGGELIASGKVGAEVDEATAHECARVCILNALAAVAAVVGGLDNIRSIVKVVGFVASDPSFSGQPTVINGASDLLGEIFGDAGSHARSAVGVSVLPKDAPVEIEMIVEVAD